MLLKNVTVVRLTDDIVREHDELTKTLEAQRFVPAREMEAERYGWIPPTGNEDDELVYSQGSVALLCLQKETKILPASVIREELKERLALREKGGRTVRAKERQNLMEEIKFELLPRAFSKHTRIMGYIDYQRQEVIVGTASANQAEEFLSSLRASLGSLPVTPLQAEYTPTKRMTDWTRLREAPSKVKFGAEITLAEAEGGKGSFRKQDLMSEEIQQCIEAGKQVQRMSLEWNDYLTFAIDENLTIRKLGALDMFDEKYEGADDEDDALAANLYLTFMALRQLLPELYQWFGVGEPEYAADSGDDRSDPGFDVDDFSEQEGQDDNGEGFDREDDESTSETDEEQAFSE